MRNSLSSSVFDDGINNCNKLFWLKHGPTEATKLSDMGKQLGLSFQGKEEKILK